MNRPIKSKETELVIKNLPTKLIPIQNSFTSALYQIFKRKIMSILHKHFNKVQEEGPLLNSLSEVSITLTSKPDVDIPRKETTDQYLS